MHGPREFIDVRGFALASKVEDADAVVCTSDFTRGRLMMLVDEPHWSKITVAHAGIDVAAWPAIAPSDNDGGLRVLIVARLAPEKGVGVLLDAMGQLPADVTLTVVGDGDRRPLLEAEAHRLGLDARVRFAGAVGHDSIREFYAAADVFCLASFDEGVPLVLMEAMASGLPVVATRVGGVPELVEDGAAGFVVPAGRSDALAAALGRLRDEPTLREKFALRGREVVVEAFAVDDQAAELEQLFRRLQAEAGADTPTPPRVAAP